MSTAPVTQTTGSAATTSTATDAIAETAILPGIVAINDDAEAKLILNVPHHPSTSLHLLISSLSFFSYLHLCLYLHHLIFSPPGGFLFGAKV